MLQTEKRTLKNCQVNKVSKTPIAIPFNLLQICPSVSCFVYAVDSIW